MLEKFVVRGRNRLRGEVNISGAKNAAVAIIPATILSDGVCTIENIPNINDVTLIARILKEMGADVSMVDKTTMKIDSNGISSPVATCESVKRIRASSYLLGALLGKFHKAKVLSPGGCNFGVRPIDQHLKAFSSLGAKCKVESGVIDIKAEKLIGSSVYMDTVSVGATINALLASVKAEGTTVIENAAKEPHIVDVANFLNTMGANIKGAGTDVIRVRGVAKLHGAEYSIIPDQIEAGTFMTMAVATRGNVLIKNVIPKHLEAISSKLMEMGATVIEYDDSVRVMADGTLKPTQIKTLPYPGFPTDMQAQMAATLALSRGTSIVTESIFENRFRYVQELCKMGADIRVEGNTAIIHGVDKYLGANLVAPDLRAGAALVIAALAADGFSLIDDIKFIKRGYENFDEKIRNLGGVIEIIDSERDYQKYKLKIG